MRTSQICRHSSRVGTITSAYVPSPLHARSPPYLTTMASDLALCSSRRHPLVHLFGAWFSQQHQRQTTILLLVAMDGLQEPCAWGVPADMRLLALQVLHDGRQVSEGLARPRGCVDQGIPPRLLCRQHLETEITIITCN